MNPMARAEELAAKSGPGIGGLLNVTFGNAPELIIARIALNAGLQEVVKASIIGSILGNVLLVMGLAMLVGGAKRERQFFDRTAANVQVLMLLLAGAALVLPAIFQLVDGGRLPRVSEEERRSKAARGRPVPARCYSFRSASSGGRRRMSALFPSPIATVRAFTSRVMNSSRRGDGRGAGQGRFMRRQRERCPLQCTTKAVARQGGGAGGMV